MQILAPGLVVLISESSTVVVLGSARLLLGFSVGVLVAEFQLYFWFLGPSFPVLCARGCFLSNSSGSPPPSQWPPAPLVTCFLQ